MKPEELAEAGFFHDPDDDDADQVICTDLQQSKQQKSFRWSVSIARIRFGTSSTSTSQPGFSMPGETYKHIKENRVRYHFVKCATFC